MQVFTCLWNSTMLGSLDLLLIDSYDTLNRDHARSNSRIWRNLFWKQKSWQLSFAQPPPMPHIYMRIVSMIPHSYLVHFELVQTHWLLSVLCTFYSGHTRTRVNHYPSWSVIQGSSSPWNKKKTSKVSHHTHESLFKKKETKRRGKDDKSKSIDDG